VAFDHLGVSRLHTFLLLDLGNVKLACWWQSQTIANITPENVISGRAKTSTAMSYRISPYIEYFREYVATIEAPFWQQYKLLAQDLLLLNGEKIFFLYVGAECVLIS
jgi:hypothetical protein